MLALKADEEEFKGRDKGMQQRYDNSRSAEEKLYKASLGVVVEVYDHKGTEAELEQVCANLNKYQVVDEFQVYKVDSDHVKIVRVLLPQRKVDCRRLLVFIQEQFVPFYSAFLASKGASQQVAKSKVASYTFLHILRLIQSCLHNQASSEALHELLSAHLPKEERTLLMEMQPEDEKEILANLNYYLRLKAVEEKMQPVTKDLVVKRNVIFIQA
jgi:hypothetical protein